MKLKVKVSDVTKESLRELEQIQLRKCKAFLEYCPFANPTYMSMKTGINISFIVAHRKEIGI